MDDLLALPLALVQIELAELRHVPNRQGEAGAAELDPSASFAHSPGTIPSGWNRPWRAYSPVGKPVAREMTADMMCAEPLSYSHFFPGSRASRS